MDSSFHFVGHQENGVEGIRSPNDEVRDEVRLHGQVQDPIRLVTGLRWQKENNTLQTIELVENPHQPFYFNKKCHNKCNSFYSRDRWHLQITLVLTQEKSSNLHGQHVPQRAVLVHRDAPR
jgi:hypothetical protein